MTTSTIAAGKASHRGKGDCLIPIPFLRLACRLILNLIQILISLNNAAKRTDDPLSGWGRACHNWVDSNAPRPASTGILNFSASLSSSLPSRLRQVESEKHPVRLWLAAIGLVLILASLLDIFSVGTLIT
jgi:hypothetical protein